MRYLLSLAFIVTISALTFAQEAEYKAENEGWLVDVEEAYRQSQKTGKPILANFTGSDWCGWCKRLTKSVFVKDKFKKWAAQNVILLELDFPRRKQLPEKYKKQNRQLQQAFSVRGYPTVWLFTLTKDEATNQFNIDALGKTGYTKTAEEFTTNIDKMIARSNSSE